MYLLQQFCRFGLIGLLCYPLLLLAGPGAHGPNGEHLDAPSSGHHSSVHPKLESHSEDFELVAELEAQQLRVFVDRYLTNEPVLNAQLELELNTQQVPAQFEASSGSYLFRDAKLIQQLHQAGEHNLVFTLLAGEASDLLEGSLLVAKAEPVQDKHNHPVNLWQWSSGLLLLLVFLLLFRTPKVKS